MTENKTSEAQLRANRKWEEKNREKTRIDGYKRTARSYLRKHAKIEDLEEFKIIIEEREKQLKNME